MNSSLKVVFITGRINRSGASTYLLKLCKDLKFRFPEMNLKILVLNPELQLIKEFEKFAKVISLRKFSRFYLIRLFNIFYSYFLIKKYSKKAGVLFFNSVDSLVFFNKFKLANKKVILHCHEMPINIKLEWPWFESFNKFAIFDHIISDTRSALDFIRELSGQDLLHQNLRIIRPIIHLNVQIETTFKGQLPFTIGNLATQYLGKGVDLFVLTAIQYCLRYPNDVVLFEFLGPETSELSKTLRSDIVKAGLENKIILGREVANPDEFYKNMSLFFLSSRTESYSTSMLEAASFGVPVICFNASGESHDFVKCVEENVIDYMNIESVIGRIRSYYLDRASLKRDGEIMRNYLDKPGVVGTTEEIVDLILN